MTGNFATIEDLLRNLCGGSIAEKDYVGYFLNEYGEHLVFAQRPGEKTARIWHSDTDWEMYRVGVHSIRVGQTIDGMITVDDNLIINQHEASWLSACLTASRHLRQP
ncbi:hypothetical protein [Kribbella sp. NPDC051718]|uniref:hypothetical protein n=1 Tax=Kribbella sp. NPDC051718 TaxID=3155168 RepID=UPI00341D166A